MNRPYGFLPDGRQAMIYTLRCGEMQAEIMDYGATLVRLFVPDNHGEVADVVLGYDNAFDYAVNNSNLGATVGRNANRVKDAAFYLGGERICLSANDGGNNLHSGPDIYNHRMWQVEAVSNHAITLFLHSPHGDQGFPGNAQIRVTYTLLPPATLQLRYEAVADLDTVFNMTNHSYFNLAGHQHPELAMEQILQLPSAYFTPDDAQSIPTGEMRSVEGTPMDFRSPKAIGTEIETPYDALQLQQGYDHNYAVSTNPCAVLLSPDGKRRMQVFTDCPGIQFYSGNYLDKIGKDGIHYARRGGICLETQYFPNAVNYPQWRQPFFRAGEVYRSVTEYRFG